MIPGESFFKGISMAVNNHKTYKCDECSKEHDTKTDGKIIGWFKLYVKCHYGSDKKNTHTSHVCGIDCASKIMKKYKSINWTKMEAIDF